MVNKGSDIVLSGSVMRIVFKMPVADIKWRCCLSNDVIDTSFLEVKVEPSGNRSVEFIEFMRTVRELFRKHVEENTCTVAEEIVLELKEKLQEKYPLHNITVKLVFLERDRETNTVAVVEVEA